MSHSPDLPTVSHERKMELLAGLHGFDKLPKSSREALAAELKLEVFAPGSTVVEERELGDRLFIIASGLAEVSSTGPTGKVVLDELSTGKMFGEIALVSRIRRRKATVSSVTQLVTLSLSAHVFEKLLAEHPDIHSDFVENAEALMAEKLQKLSHPHQGDVF